jgi:hypothetical protein
MSDMTPVIAAKSDQLNADDLIGGPRTITITRVDVRDTKDQPVSVFYEGDDGKPWKPCKSMSRVLAAAWGTDSKIYPGRSLTLFREPSVKWGGIEVGGIRISHMSHIPEPLLLAITITKGSKKPYRVEPLQTGKGDDGAQELADDLIRRAEALNGDASALAALAAREAIIKRREWLAEANPALAAKVDAAFLATVDTATPDNPTAAEGPSDDDRGEAHNDEPHPAQAAVDAHLKRLMNAEFKSDVDMVISDFSANKEALPDHLRGEVEAAEHNRLMSFSTAGAG